MKIAIDLDEVLNTYLSALIAFYHARSGVLLDREAFRHTDWQRGFDLPDHAFKELLAEFAAHPLFLDMPPCEAAATGIPRLARDHELVLVSARPPALTNVTIAWIERHFPATFTAVHCTGQFTKEGAWQTKAEVCAAIGASAIVDDQPEYAAQCADAGIIALLLDRPWNRHTTTPGLIRVRTWDEILRELS